MVDGTILYFMDKAPQLLLIVWNQYKGAMPHWSRRRLLASGAAAALAPRLLPAMSAPGAGESLDELARAKGLRFGTALGARSVANTTLTALIKSQCGVIVPENELKMPSLQPTPGTFRFDAAESLLAFAETNHLLTRGHCLLWHHPRWVPAWLNTYDFGADAAKSAADLLATHIRNTTRHFGKRIASWDVINEAVDNVTGEMRPTPLSRAMGSAEAVLDLAFHAAREHLPETELVYNDYMGWETAGGPHRDGVLRLLEHFRRANVPVDALGIQAHLGSGNQDNNAARPFDGRDERAWRKFLDEVTGMGYQLLITELDVHDATVPGDIATRDREVAALGRAFLDLTLDYRQVNVLVCWGLTDNHTWLQGRTPRSDGMPKRPTPYDVEYRAKPLREAIAAALRAAPMRG
jgi:endo-1,4-beta-xylanase